MEREYKEKKITLNLFLNLLRIGFNQEGTFIFEF